MLKKTGQKSRSQRRDESYCSSYFESLNVARTTFGEERVLARRSWAGKTGDFFGVRLEHRQRTAQLETEHECQHDREDEQRFLEDPTRTVPLAG